MRRWSGISDWIIDERVVKVNELNYLRVGCLCYMQGDSFFFALNRFNACELAHVTCKAVFGSAFGSNGSTCVQWFVSGCWRSLYWQLDNCVFVMSPNELENGVVAVMAVFAHVDLSMVLPHPPPPGLMSQHTQNAILQHQDAAMPVPASSVSRNTPHLQPPIPHAASAATLPTRVFRPSDTHVPPAAFSVTAPPASVSAAITSIAAITRRPQAAALPANHLAPSLGGLQFSLRALPPATVPPTPTMQAVSPAPLPVGAAIGRDRQPDEQPDVQPDPEEDPVAWAEREYLALFQEDK